MIRTARIDDKTNIAALMIQVWLHTYATEGLRDAISRYVLTQFTPEKIGEALSSPDQLYLVAEVDAHIVGLAVLDWTGICPATDVPMPALQKLYVQEHFTGKGIGSLLLERSTEKCRELNYSKLWLTVQPQNVRAVNFYRKHGFLHAGTTNFVLEDELHENYVLHKETI